MYEIRTGCRLHFGMFGFGHADQPQFGGVGAMIAEPRVTLRATPSDHWSVTGPGATRVMEFASRWQAFHRATQLPAVHVQTVELPDEHTGLGSGTQLGLATGALLQAVTEGTIATPHELALSVGRGLRSAVGTYGFFLGGLIVERGKSPGEGLSPLAVRLDIPAEWRFVLATPQAELGLHGEREREAFARLPPVPHHVTERLVSLARHALIPLVTAGDFPHFGPALDEYCRVAGECFATIQGGPYNGPVLTELVSVMRNCGATGVGQSSWGPTLFAVCAHPTEAEQLVSRLRRRTGDTVRYRITSPMNRGFQLTRGASSSG